MLQVWLNPLLHLLIGRDKVLYLLVFRLLPLLLLEPALDILIVLLSPVQILEVLHELNHLIRVSFSDRVLKDLFVRLSTPFDLLDYVVACDDVLITSS